MPIMLQGRATLGAAVAVLCSALPLALADDSKDLAPQLRELESKVRPMPATKMLSDHARARLRAANQRESNAWQAVQTRADWEKYRDPRLQALRGSLGSFPPVPKDLNVRVT